MLYRPLSKVGLRTSSSDFFITKCYRCTLPVQALDIFFWQGIIDCMKGLSSTFLIVGVLAAIALGIFVFGNKEFDSTRFGASVLPPELPEQTLTPEPELQPEPTPAPEPTPQPEPQPQPQPQTFVSSSSLLKIKIDPVPVQAGQDITITLSTEKDLSSPLFLVDVSLVSPSSSQTVKSSLVNIDGDGNRFGSIDIPADAEKGAWTIQSIEIDDRSGVVDTYTHGKEISVTFTIL